MLSHSRILKFPLRGHKTFYNFLITFLCREIWKNFLTKIFPLHGFEILYIPLNKQFPLRGHESC